MKVYNGNLKLALSRIAAVGLLTAAIAAVGTPVAAQNTAPPAQAQSQSESRIIRIAAAPNSAPHQITLALNKAAIIELDHDARDVFVGNPAIVDAVVRTPKRIFIMALKIGQTNAIFLDNEGRHIATLEIVVGSDVADLNNQIAHQMPDARVKAEALNDTIVLGGTVTSAQQASQIQDMATRYAGSVDKVVNGLKIQQASQVLIK